MESNLQISVEALQHTPAMVSLHRINGVTIMRNPSAMNCFGFINPDTPDCLFDRISNPEVRQRLESAINNHETFTEELLTETRQGHRWHYFDVRIILDESNQSLLLVNELDIHQRKLASDRAYKLAYYDRLTQLPNRVAFANRINDMLLQLLHIKGKTGLIIYLNILHFSDVNSTFGFDAGDKLLIDVGKRLQESLPEVELVSRVEGDKFGIALFIKDTTEAIQAIIDKIAGLFARPFDVLGHSYLLSIRMGLSLMPEHAHSETEASRVTDIALNHTKNKGRNTWVLYDPNMTIEITAKTRRVQQLYEAMAKGYFQLFFQPQINLKTRKISGVETLLRWRMEDGSFVSPSEFIPLAEQLGVIHDITRWVLMESCRLNKSWQDRGFGNIRISVNISGKEFTAKNFVDLVRQSLELTELDPSLLELEVTETALVSDMDKATETLHQLRDLGVELAIDDFGVGHSSLAYLKRFPIQRLKIDKVFVNNSNLSDKDLAVIRSIISLAEAFDLSVIAEGIETLELADMMCNENCQEGQGYYFSEPLSTYDFEVYLQQQSES